MNLPQDTYTSLLALRISHLLNIRPHAEDCECGCSDPEWRKHAATVAIQAVNALETIAGRVNAMQQVTVQPTAVPLADAVLFKKCFGIAPSQARRLHRSSGFPLRFNGEGVRRAAYAVSSEVEMWFKKRQAE